MRSLITGITGFVGSHLAEHLLAQGAEVFGTARWRSDTANIDHLEGRIGLVECDIRDSASVKQVLLDVRPDEIYHLAAQSFVPTSWRAPSETLETNIVGEVHLLEAVRGLDPSPRVQIAGSSEEYGMAREDELPIRETNPLRPLSPYAVSKVGQDLLAYQYAMSYGLHLVRTRAFNHTGPRRGSVFVTSNFAKQIADIEKGRQEPVMRVGNLEARRDFTDVRDIVRGYVLAVREGEPGEVYNLCSGVARTIREVLDLLLSRSQVQVKVEQEPARMRPSDVPVLQGDFGKFHARTGWKPQIPFEQTVADLLDYWRGQA
ncbi:MAG TPA: GDP-mannose 4,6-dehydratase [Armatimonadota bacterium]|nr:GDP-mannose 4,6-dehydratase [Armatimonadota bacterium]